LPLAGIIAEFNPLHNGHQYLIDTAKREGFDVATVISGNFVQRGDTAIIPKFKRTESALSAGADIVLELPIPWSMSTAQNFALGGVSQLSAVGIDALFFGSECGDIQELYEVARILSSDEFNDRLKTRLSCGATFAKLRSELVGEILGKETDILSSPNDTLAVEYILAARRLGLSTVFRPIKRVGAMHNDKTEQSAFTTATLLRNAIISDDFEYVARFTPKHSYDIIKDSPISNIRRIDTAILAGLKQMKPAELSRIIDISEGLDNLIYKSLRDCCSLEELTEKIKSKRYTLARIRRIILSAFLGIDNRFFLTEPPYVRVLGFNDNGEKYLSGTKVKPVITKVSQIEKISEFAKLVFDKENTANEIYALTLDDPVRFISEQREAIRRFI